MYADYDFYQQAFHGKLIPDTEWPRYVLLAEQYLTEVTFGRADPSLDAVRMAACAVAEELYHRDNNRESGEGLAAPYAAARRWLSGSGLLYNGV